MKKCLLVVGLFFLLMILGDYNSVEAQELTGNEMLYSVLPGGLDNFGKNKPVVEEALQKVSERQMLVRNRVVKFLKPIRIDTMNEKYISVAFKAEIKQNEDGAWNNAIFAILFETTGHKGVMFPNTTYLSWVGDNDFKQFETLTIDDLYESYQEMGVDDCRPGFVRTGLEKTVIGKADIRHTHDASAIVSGTLSESVIPKGIARTSDMDKAVQSAMKKMEDRISELEKTVSDLQKLLEGVSRKNGTIQFSDVNVQIVSGEGATDKINGKGNLIVGYDESGDGYERSGSHNIIVGSHNSYSGYGGIVAGRNNEIDGKYAAVIGGEDNSATGDYATVTGGAKNKAKGKYSSIHGQIGRTKVDEGQNPHFQ